jgi:flagellar hook-basal body complex protein FliE
MIEALSLNATNAAGMAAVTATPEAAARPISVPTGMSFDTVFSGIAADAMNTFKAGEVAAISGLQGKASAQQVVEAVMSAERTLQMAVAVRDKVVQAYQEVTRMAI